MYLFWLGVIALLLKWQEIGFVADMSWWTVLSPFAAALIWWAWADWSGYTKRKAMERDEARKQARIERQRSQIRMVDARSSRKRGRR
jgi:small Trp-rich protein